MYGCVPQVIIDNEADQIQNVHKSNSELEELKKVSINGYKKYLKSRPLPSSESTRRMKEESWDRKIGNHPIFNEYINSIMSQNHQNLEEERQSLLNSLKMLRPKTTVFEMSQTKKVKMLLLSNLVFVKQYNLIGHYRLSHLKFDKHYVTNPGKI